MKFNSLIRSILFVFLIVCSGILNSCDVFNEDMPECRLSVKFKYDYNMLSTDEFHSQVDQVTLFIFDKEDNFLFKQSAEGTSLATGEYLMDVQLPVGQYKFMAWAGVHDSYELSTLKENVSTITDLKLLLKRDESLIIDKKLDPLWYGEIIDVHFTGTSSQTEVINLIKDTKRIRCMFQNSASNNDDLLLDNYTFEILSSNGYLDYDNSLLKDEVLRYRPYYVEQKNNSTMIVELNTLRLVPGHDARFIITEKATATTVLDIDLIDFFSLVEMEGNKWSEQEYFDRQSEYLITFYLKDPSTSWIAAQIVINGWTLYNQGEEVEF